MLLAGCAAGALTLALAGGCRGDRSDNPPRQFLPDMDDQPRWHAQGESRFFADGRMMRLPPDGTVPFGAWPLLNDEAGLGEAVARRASFLKEDRGFYEGLNADGSPVRTIPAPVTGAMLERGAERFNIFCAVCHGYEGDGQGIVGTKWSYPVPSVHLEQYQPGGDLGQDGHIFRVAMWGVVAPDGRTAMPGYAHALSEEDGWAVVAYVRALQASRQGSIDDPNIPESVRRNLRQQRSAAPTPPPANNNNGNQNQDGDGTPVSMNGGAQ